MATIKGDYNVFYRQALSNDAPEELMAYRALLFEAMGRSDIDIEEINGDVVITGPMGKLTGLQILGLASLAVPGTDARLHLSDLHTFAIIPQGKIGDAVPKDLPNAVETAEDGIETSRTWGDWRNSNHSLATLQNGDFALEGNPFGESLDSDALLLMAGAGLEILSQAEYDVDSRKPEDSLEV